MPGVEFVDPDPDGPGQDEELSTRPPRTGSLRLTRGVRTAAGTILAVVAGAVLVGVLHHGRPSPAGSATLGAGPALAPEAPVSAFRVDHLGADAPEGARPGTLAGQSPPTVSACPTDTGCRVDHAVPAAVREALRHALPNVTHIALLSVVVGDTRLSVRQIVARAGRLAVLVQIQPRGGGVQMSSASASGDAVAVIETSVDGDLLVTAIVSGPQNEVPAVTTVRALAADRRLLTVS